jgi:hypothetical protein
MIFSLATFIVSGVAIIGFFLLKLYQGRSGKLVVVPHVRQKAEIKLRNGLQSLSDRKTAVVRAIPHLPRRLVSHSKSLVVAFEKKIDSSTHNLPSLIRGRQNISRTGKASNHIQEMLDNRSNGVDKI